MPSSTITPVNSYTHGFMATDKIQNPELLESAIKRLKREALQGEEFQQFLVDNLEAGVRLKWDTEIARSITDQATLIAVAVWAKVEGE